MHKTLIEWTYAVWNPCDGCNGANGTPCQYCYARKFAMRFKDRYAPDFKPRFYPYRLVEPYEFKPRNVMVFVCSMGDLFGIGYERWWQEEILHVINDNTDLTFQVLTKRPDLIPDDMDYPNHMWIGTSVTNNDDLWRINSLTRDSLMSAHNGIKFVSFEPIFEKLYFPDHINMNRVEWGILGIQTNPVKKISVDAIDTLLNVLNRNNIPYFCKNSIIANYEGFGKQHQNHPNIVKNTVV